VDFEVKRFNFNFYMGGPSKFVVYMTPKYRVVFFVEEIKSLLRVMGGGGQRPGRREKIVVCVDLLRFILILHRLNQFWSTSRCVRSASEALVRIYIKKKIQLL